jgi:hypothetical protein
MSSEWVGVCVMIQLSIIILVHIQTVAGAQTSHRSLAAVY